MKTLRIATGWIARIYLGLLALIYVVIAPIGLVFFDQDGFVHGLGRFWATYSPFNILNWLLAVLLVAPGLLLLAWANKKPSRE